MAGEHDFAPMSDEYVERWASSTAVPDAAADMARELRASRAAMRALVEAELREAQALRFWQNYRGDTEAERLRRRDEYGDWCQNRKSALDAIRALVAHVGAEGEGRE